MATSEMSEKDRHALKAVEESVLNKYTTYTRSTTQHWGFDDEELAKLRYNDNPGKRDGYLIAGIHSSRIVEHQASPDEEWAVEIVVDVGFLTDPETYRVYQALDGKWIVEPW